MIQRKTELVLRLLRGEADLLLKQMRLFASEIMPTFRT